MRGTTTVCPPPPGANCTPPRPGGPGSAGDWLPSSAVEEELEESPAALVELLEVVPAIGPKLVARPVGAKGFGCETCGVSVTRTVSVPCATATVLIRTFSPMTMTPFCSSMTTRAGWSGSTRSCSMSVISEITSPLNSPGTVSSTVLGSSGRAAGPLRNALIA